MRVCNLQKLEVCLELSLIRGYKNVPFSPISRLFEDLTTIFSKKLIEKNLRKLKQTYFDNLCDSIVIGRAHVAVIQMNSLSFENLAVFSLREHRGYIRGAFCARCVRVRSRLVERRNKERWRGEVFAFQRCSVADNKHSRISRTEYRQSERQQSHAFVRPQESHTILLQ